MLNLILIVSLVGLMVASVTDIRTREVPDWLNFSLISAGLGLRLIYSVITYDFNFFWAGLLGFGVFLALAYIMFYAGQWGGGDSKLLMAMGALLGLELNKESILLSFIIYLFLFGAIYGFIWSIALAVKHRKKFRAELERITGEVKNFKLVMFAVLLTMLLFVIFVKEASLKYMLFGFAVLIYLTFYMWIFVKAVENACMIKYIKTSKLTEGDWVAEEVKIKGKYICGPKDLGIERKQIDLLRKLKVKEILIKEGIPFVPSFLFGFIGMLAFGNLWDLFI